MSPFPHFPLSVDSKTKICRSCSEPLVEFILNCTSWENCRMRSFILPLLMACSPSVPNFSNGKGGHGRAENNGPFHVFKRNIACFGQVADKSTGKGVAALVGSKTSSSGSAGAKKTLSLLNNSAPCSPFLMTRYFGPIAMIFRAALISISTTVWPLRC